MKNKALNNFVAILLSILILISNVRVLAMEEPQNTWEYTTNIVETQNISDNYAQVYADGKIHIYNLNQLKAIGTDQKLKDKDDQEDGFGLGQQVVVDGNNITYSLDADYVLENDIPLNGECWNLPEGFTGTFTSKEIQDSNTLYDQEKDIIYIYNSYQLDMLSSNDPNKNPLLSTDYDVNQFGMGQLLYKKDSEEYLTYSQEHQYVVSMYFTEERPETEALIAQKESEAQQDLQNETKAMGQWKNAQLSGRDSVGQVYKEINGIKYILIGNELQLKAIGSEKRVTPTLILHRKSSLHHPTDTYTPLYPGDADFDRSIELQLDESETSKFKYFDESNESNNELMNVDFSNGLLDSVDSILGGILGGLFTGDYEILGYESLTGEYIDKKDLADTYQDLKYTNDANYIIFRDIDLKNVNWSPLMFSGTMIGSIAEGQGALWPDNNISLSSKPVISNINVHQTEAIDTTKQAGVGFFGSIMSTSENQIGVSDGQVLVKNLKLQNVTVQNQADKIKDNTGLINRLLGIIGNIVGALLGDLGDALDNLLNPNKNGDPTVFATGAFAGRISGDVRVEDCEVKNITQLSNVHDYIGGFVGHVEGITEYGALQEKLGDLTAVLENILNVIPFVDLGTLINVLLDGNVIQLDQLIPTGYKNPVISNCHAFTGGNLQIGNSQYSYAGAFVGKAVGTVIKDSTVTGSQLTIVGKDMIGGFAGLIANAELVGLLDNLGVDLIQSMRLNTFLLNCQVKSDSLSVSASGKYSGGITGATANSFIVDSTITSSTQIQANQYAGGVTGVATLGQAVSLGEYYGGKKDLVSLISKILSGTLTGDQENTLLSLTGISPSILAGNEIIGSLSINVDESYAGGLAGQGDGLKIISSADLGSKSFVWNGIASSLNYSVKSRANQITHLVKVSGKNYVGGIIGEARTASASGLLNHTLGIGNFLKFDISDVQTTNIDSGILIQSQENYAGGFAGRAIGGNVSRVYVTEMNQVTGQNYVGGFIGYGGTGSLAETEGLNILGLVNISNLLSIADGLVLEVNDANVTGIIDGFEVIATGTHQETSDKTKYYAGGFIGKSTSVHINNANVNNLKSVSADQKYGYAGGFSGVTETGGLAEAAGEDSSALELIGIQGLLNAVPYLISDFTNTKVDFIASETPQVKASYAGGFIGEMQSGKVDNSTSGDAYAVYGATYIQGEYYSGGFVGKMYSGGLASSNGLSILNGSLNIDISNLLSILNVYIPTTNYAGISSQGLIVETLSMDPTDLNSGVAGGYIGYGSGVKISHSDVNQLRNTKVQAPSDLNGSDGTSYFGSESKYAISGISHSGGYVGKLDIGSSASLGEGLELAGLVEIGNLTQALDVVASKVESSNVYGAVGGYSIKANGVLDENDLIGNAGGFAGSVYGSQLQNCNAYNFNYIIGQETAGGYVGTMQPGNVANVIGKTEILGGVLTSSTNLASVLQSFIPMIYNSETTSVPCGGAVRANAKSDETRARGLAGGYVGYNLGGRIEGNSSRSWNGIEPTVKRENAVYRLRSVYGYEFAGGFSGRTESANVVDTGNISVLFGLIKLSNPLEAISAVYPTETHTATYGPLRGLDVETWNSWVNAIGVNGSYGQQLQQLGPVSSQEELDQIIETYAYGYDVKAGRNEPGTLSTQGGVAGGYVGRMDGGVITMAHAKDLKTVLALRSSGGFVGEMMSAGVVNVGGLDLAGIDVIGSLPVLETFVPVIDRSSTTGYRSGATVIADGTDLVNQQGHAGGFAGIIIGGQIKGDADHFVSINNLKKVSGTNTVGGFAGSILTGSAANVDVSSNSGLLPGILGPLLGNPGDLAKVLNATVSTIQYAKVQSWDPWGIVIDGTYRLDGEAQTQYAYAAGGFVGSMSGSVLGDKDAEIDSLIVENIRNVIGGEHAGGFFGVADVSAVAQVGENQSDSILNLIQLGELDVLDAFRTYVYHGMVQGSLDNGLTVNANEETESGTLNSKVYTGNAGGFGGSLYNGSVKDSQVTYLNQVNALNYGGGFIGHLGKSGVVDLDKVGTDSILNGLLNATAGVMDNFGSHVDRSTVDGYDAGYIVSSQSGQEAIAGGFAGLADLARIDGCHASNLKMVKSDQIAGGFGGKTSFSYLADIDAGSSALLGPVLLIVNTLLDYLYIDNLENINAIEIDLDPLLKLDVLSDGNTLSVDLLGLKISVALVKNNGSGTSDVAQIHIGDSYIEVPCTNTEGNHIADEDKENIKIGLIKSNRTKIENSSVSGIALGYDVFGGGATQETDGTHKNGSAGGFIGLNNEGLLENNDVLYADTIRGTSDLVGPFTGKTMLETGYSFNTIKGIEGTNNRYRVYRDKNEFTQLQLRNEVIFETEQTNPNWNEFVINHILEVEKFNDFDQAYLLGGTNQKQAGVYISSSKAVLMEDIKVADNEQTTTPPPSDMQDPCDELIDLTINKVWKDFSNLENIRPDKITVRLTRSYVIDGQRVQDGEFNQVIDITASEQKDTWQYIVQDLPAYRVLDDGTHVYYIYELTEDSVNDYDAQVKVSVDGYTITIVNTHVPFLPDTGGSGTLLFTVIGLFGISFVLLSFKKGRRNHEKNL